MTPDDAALPDRCLLENRMFATLGDVSFRRAVADGTPVMIVTMGEREAALPLRALQREFGIEDASADGRMLALIAESLDYVVALSLGDRLPAEVVDGRASWEPDLQHRKLALTKLRVELLTWIDPAATDPAKGDPVARLETDPALRQQVQRAFERAAVMLELVDSNAVVTLVEELAGELAYIEALRDRVLRPVQGLTVRLERLSVSVRGDMQRQETITRVARLMIVARNQLLARFTDIAAQTGEVMSALRNIESQTSFIRSNRDQLYRSQRAWQPLLDAWRTAEVAQGAVPWDLVARTYHFLAARHMPVTEWRAVGAQRTQRAPPKQVHAMTW